ncbi:placenta growth factor [Trematomus bernacchii]|uniref:Platelet-derived growth factor (PDGF) family profile domain-containing protein n=2 Tax=Nototheniidae TaxID=8206 RepID=A0ABD2G5C6_PAGBO|nr:placenta growth factor [Trematomus bernacchii]
MKLGLVIQTAVTLYLLLSPAQSLPQPVIHNTTEVLMFQEVWGRSFCRTIEKLVEVVQEYPTEVEHIYSPACVPLVRCAGCCGDENLECHATLTTNVTMQLLKIRPSEPGQEYVEMTFVEHQTCECRVKKPIVKVERKRQRGRGRKRKEKQKAKPKECDSCQNPRR